MTEKEKKNVEADMNILLVVKKEQEKIVFKCLE